MGLNIRFCAMIFDPWSDITTIELDQTLGTCPAYRTIRSEWEFEESSKPTGPWAFDIELTLDWGSVDARFPALIVQADVSAKVAGQCLEKTSALVLGCWRKGAIEMGTFPAPAKVRLVAENVPEQPGKVRRDVDLPFIRHITVWRPSLSGLGGVISVPIELGLCMTGHAAEADIT